MATLTPPARRHFIAELRVARSAALADAECFDQILFAVERLGGFLLGRADSLAGYRDALLDLAKDSGLAHLHEDWRPAFRVERLFEIVQRARNDAMHQGAAARHLTGHCIDLALILEDAILTGAATVADFMIDSPILAKDFETVASIRRIMLMNAFSYMPVRLAGGWQLVADVQLMRFLRQAVSGVDRKRRLGASLGEACQQYELKLEQPATFCMPTEEVSCLLHKIDVRPALVTRDGTPEGDLVGMLTSFDLL
jgi:CBS domain-containing protein